jgi:lipopolysaccharide transport system permease protein
VNSISTRILTRVPIRTGLGLIYTLRLMNPRSVVRNLWRERELILQLASRDVTSRYKGSYLGLLWSLLNPVLMLTIYTFVFGVLFKARWGLEGEGRLEFALVLFSGLIIFGLFSECANRAPSLIVSAPQYVKKVQFPLQVLPVVSTLSALAHASISLVVLVIGLWLGMGLVHWTIVWLPLVVLPLLLLSVGLGWLLSALGVFLRDISQMTGIATTAMLFLSPIFYPVSRIPEQLRPYYAINPLSVIIEQTRRVLIWGTSPDWLALSIVTVSTGLLALAGFAWFQRTRRGFADVM